MTRDPRRNYLNQSTDLDSRAYGRQIAGDGGVDEISVFAGDLYAVGHCEFRWLFTRRLGSARYKNADMGGLGKEASRRANSLS